MTAPRAAALQSASAGTPADLALRGPAVLVQAAVAEAARYGLYDLDRLERMILRRIARDYFLLKEWKGSPDEDQ